MSPIIDLLFPRRCYGCGHPGCYFCAHCSYRLIYRPVKPNYPKGFNGTLSLFNHHGPVKAAISDLKFNFVSDLVLEFASLTITGLSVFPPDTEAWALTLAG
jgi:predicted amidophosphoribosyltransferase